MIDKLCNDYGDAPDCLGVSDPAYTMRFDTIGEEPIHFCSVCGKRARIFEAAISRTFDTRPGFAEEFKQAIEQAMAERKVN